jgi:hypothetical protein
MQEENSQHSAFDHQVPQGPTSCEVHYSILVPVDRSLQAGRISATSGFGKGQGVCGMQRRERDWDQTSKGQSHKMQVQACRDQWPILSWCYGEVHQLQGCPQIFAMEQLSSRNKALLPSIPNGLENLSFFHWAFAGAALDHRCHPPTEWLWGMHDKPHELRKQSPENMENSRQHSLVAPQLAIQ